MTPDLFPDSLRTVSVVVTAPLDGPFDYLLPDGRHFPVPGTVLAVPFGRQVLPGVVWDSRPDKAVDPGRLRPLGPTLGIPPLPAPLRRLVDHVAYQTVSPRGQVLKLALSTPGALAPPRTVDVFGPAAGADGLKLTAKQRFVLDQATGNLEMAVLIKGFSFERALMQEHFNENYLESSKFPKASFKGKLDKVSDVNFTKDGSYTTNVSGDMTIHGVTQKVSTPVIITVKDGAVSAATKFSLTLKDYGIEVPSLVADKVGKQANLAVNVDLKPM